MKVGIRKPNIEKSIKSRTIGKTKRTLKSSVDPTYNKKGIGYVKNPKKAVYNKIYNKTTIGIKDIMMINKSNGPDKITNEIAVKLLSHH